MDLTLNVGVIHSTTVSIIILIICMFFGMLALISNSFGMQAFNYNEEYKREHFRAHDFLVFFMIFSILALLSCSGMLIYIVLKK